MKINNWDDVAELFDERGYVTVSRYPDREISHPRVWISFFFYTESRKQAEELRAFFGTGMYKKWRTKTAIKREFIVFDRKVAESIIARITGKVIRKKDYLKKVQKKISSRRFS